MYESLHPAFDAVPNGDGSFSFIFSAAASGTSDSPQMRLMRGISSVTFTVHDGSGMAIDSITTTDIPASGVQGEDGNASLTATARVSWRPASPPMPPMQVVMRAVGTEGVIVRVAELPVAVGIDAGGGRGATRRERLALSLEMEPRGGAMEFVLGVERVAPAGADEYLPSGERFRIEIFGESGELIWSSSAGQMFTQALGPVVPTEVGERTTYRTIFHGRNNDTHEPLAPGVYRVVATIPAQPVPYVLREELSWSGR